MANTVSLLSYANTFGDWVVTTNALVKENNNLATSNYIKPTGTLYLNDPTLGLQVANNAIFAGQLQVQGIGSSGYIQNNLRVDQQVYFTNTVLGLTNSGQANIGGPLLALGSGTGLSVSNNATIGSNITVYHTTTTDNVVANNITTNYLSFNSANISNYLWANNATGQIQNLVVSNGLTVSGVSSFNSITTSGSLSVGGNFIINGTTVYNTPVFTINANNTVGINGYFGVNRGGSGANSQIRWNESAKYWDILDVNDSNYYRILTQEYLSDSTTLVSSSNVATSNAIATLQGGLNAANSSIQAAFNKANTGSGTFIGTTGIAVANSGVITFSSNNGVVLSGTSNSIYVNTPQDLRSTATPTFNNLTLTTPLPITSGGTGGTSAASALTNLLPAGTTAGYVLTTGGSGSFYWAAGGLGGGGTTPGTTIQSTRLTYNANGSGISYTTPSYVPGSSQLRVYINGVRQFSDTYTETSNTVVTFSTSPPSGSVILVEIDGYIVNPYFANTLPYSVNALISPTANTVQLAIDGLTNLVVNNFANTLAPTVTFTGNVAASQLTATGNVNASNVYSTNVTATGNVNAATVTASGTINATTFNSTSDQTLKDNVVTIQDALNKVVNLRGVTFNWKNTGQPSIGLIAQEAEQVLPELVSNNGGIKSISYDGIIGVLIEAIKELNAEIEVLKEK